MLKIRSMDNCNKNRQWLLISVTALTIALAGCGGKENMYRGDASHTAVYSEAGPTKLESLHWKFTAADKVYSSPTLDDGTIYLGSNDHSLYAINQESGQLKWRFKTGGNIESTPATADGPNIPASRGL